MKKLNGFIIIYSILGLTRSYGQTLLSYPIPSNGIIVNGNVNFINTSIQTDTINYSRGKREANIHLRSSTEENTGCQASVWVYSLDSTSILGPFTVLCDETITVEIDERDWGVLVQSEYQVIVDVWFD